jgi:hypothetical protein
MRDISIILANLTADEYERFHAAGIGYSGSTGLGARTDSCDGVVPYIATYLSVLPKALHAMGWERIRVKFAGEQLQIWRYEDHKPFPERPEISQLLRIAELCLETAVHMEAA